jgi:large repetitive protein
MKKAFLLSAMFLTLFWQRATAKTEPSDAADIPKILTDVLPSKYAAAMTTSLLREDAIMPSVSIAITTGSQTICAGTSVTFTATPSGVGPLVIYEWKKNGRIVVAARASATYTDTNLADWDFITCRMTDRSNSFTTTSRAITMSVNAIVAPTVTIAASPSSTITRGTSVTFTATPTNGGTPVYQWKKNNTNVGTNSATYTDANLATNDAITCTLTSNADCISTNTATSPAISMVVTITPAVNIAVTTGSQTICAGTSVTFTAMPTNEGLSPVYQWKKNGINVGTNSVTYTDATLANTDVITCVLTSNDPLASPTTATSASIAMIVKALPTIIAVPNQTLCAGNATVAIPFSGIGANEYTWTNSNPNIGLAANGSGNITAFTAANPTNTDLSATITVTPISNLVEYAYIANYNANTVSVVNTALNTIVATIPVGTNPHGVAVSPNNQWVYVTNRGSNNVSVIDAATNTVFTTIPVMPNPFKLAFSPTGQYLYVSCEGGGGWVVVIATATNAFVESFNIRGARGIAAYWDDDHVSIVNDGGQSVSMLTRTLNTVQAIRIHSPDLDNPLTGPYDLVSHPSNNKIYVTDYLVNIIHLVDATTNRVIGTIPTGNRPFGLSLNSNGSRLYVANHQSNDVTVINTLTNAVITTVPVGLNPHGISVGANGRLYVVNEGSNTVSVVDTTNYTVVATIAVGTQPISLGNFMQTSQLHCEGTPVSFRITVSPLPNAYITVATPTTFCQGENVVLNANTGAGLTYQWQHNGIALVANAASFTASMAGSYTAVVTDANTCVNTSNAKVVIVNALPIATISNNTPTTFCQGGNVVLNANTGNGLTYQWKNNGTDLAANATTATFTATNTGSYTVVVTDANGCVNTSNAKTVIVNPLPIATISNNTPTTFCQGGNVVLNTNSGNSLTYQWLNNGHALANATTTIFTAANPGSYMVVVTDANACVSTSNAKTVIVNPLPIATISNATPTTFCQGGNVVLNAPSTAGLTYQWRNNGIALNSTNSIYVANTSGTYSVRLTDANNCSATSPTTTVVVNPMPTPILTASGNRTFCQGDSAQLQISGGVNYQWSHGATDSAIWFKQAGLYTVTVTNQWGCSTPITQQIVVKPLPIATASANGVTTFCQGGQVVLNANTGANLTYQWQRNGTPMLGATNPNYTANENGLYTVVVTGLNGCSNTSNANAVIVNALPIATITPASVTTFCQGGNVVLNANQGDGLTYRWNQNGTPINGATNANYTATATGLYTVVVTNVNNCSTTSTANQVIVNALPISSIVNTTPILCNGDKSTLTVGATGGLTPYQYSTNGVNYQNSNLFELLAGNYNVNVRDNNGCTSNNTALTLTQPTVLTIPTPTAVPLNCYDGFTNLQSTANGGTTPYQYSLTGFVFQNPNQFSVQGGTYQMVVRDANGCRATSPLYNVVRPADLVLTTATNPIKCWGDTTYATIQAANAVAPIQYTLNGVSQNNDALFKGLRMGTYPVRVVDHRGCTKATTLTITQPPLLKGNVQVDSMICKGKLTPLVVTATGGTGNISYRLNEGAFQGNTFMVGAGEQKVQIRDANLCLQTLPTVLVEDATAKMGEFMHLKINCHDMDMRIYPNPVVDVMSVDFKIAKAGVVKVVVYNALGDLIAHEDYKNIEAGSYTASWDTANWASDMVRVCLEVDGVCMQVTSVMIVH